MWLIFCLKCNWTNLPKKKRSIPNNFDTEKNYINLVYINILCEIYGLTAWPWYTFSIASLAALAFNIASLEALDSTSKPEALHIGRPPSNTHTLSCPKTRNILYNFMMTSA